MADLSQFMNVFGDIRMVAKILKVEPTTTGKGWRIQVEGSQDYFYVFNQSFFNLIQPGAQVDLSLQRQGRYTQVIGVAPAYFGAIPGAPASTPTSHLPPATTQPGIPSYDVSQQPGGGAIPGSSLPNPATAQEPQFDNNPPAPFDKDSTIIRQSILKSPVLVELFKNLKENMNVEGVIALAQRLEKYVHRGE